MFTFRYSAYSDGFEERIAAFSVFLSSYLIKVQHVEPHKNHTMLEKFTSRRRWWWIQLHSNYNISVI